MFVGISREILDIPLSVLTKYAPSITYNELTYQSEGLTGHRGLFMSGAIYIDVVFVTNLLMDYILLRILGFILRLKSSGRRCFGAAAAGALFACFILYIPVDGGPLISAFFHGICAAGMIRIAYGIKKGGLLLKAMTVLYLTAFLSGGFWEAAAGDSMNLWIFGLLAFCTYMGISAAVCFADSIRARRKNIYPITLSWQGREQAAYGFYDTGNMLSDPVSGEPVSIAEPELLETILSGELVDKLKHLKENPGELKSTEIAALRPRYLSCRTVGNTECLMLAVTLEDLCIYTPKEAVRISRPVFALAFEPSALGKEYKVLLNSRLLH